MSESKAPEQAESNPTEILDAEALANVAGGGRFSGLSTVAKWAGHALTGASILGTLGSFFGHKQQQQ